MSWMEKAEIDEIKKRLEKLEELLKPSILDYKKLVPKARLEKAHDNDSCADVFATSVNHEEAYIEYGTGLSFNIPKGHEIKAYARSSVSVTPLFLANGVGVVDEGYKGELILRFKVAHGYKTRRYDVGDKIGQIQLVRKTPFVLNEVNDVGTSSRGSGGFGSSGK